MTDQAEPRGPMYEFMVGTFDMNDQEWLQSMQAMLNSYGLAGWQKPMLHEIDDKRFMLVIMQREYPAPFVPVEEPSVAEVSVDAYSDTTTGSEPPTRRPGRKKR